MMMMIYDANIVLFIFLQQIRNNEKKTLNKPRKIFENLKNCILAVFFLLNALCLLLIPLKEQCDK